MTIDREDMLEPEIAKAGYLLADLLCSSLMPSNGSWFYARPTYIWEHNALCWLARNRDRIPTMNAWTAMLLSDGYPAKAFLTGDDQPCDAGHWWNASMSPKPDGSDDDIAEKST